jgi:hypothetical protein
MDPAVACGAIPSSTAAVHNVGIWKAGHFRVIPRQAQVGKQEAPMAPNVSLFPAVLCTSPGLDRG